MTTTKVSFIALLLLSALFNNTNAYSNVPVTPTIENYSPLGYIVIIEAGRIVINAGTNLLITIENEGGEQVFRKRKMNTGDIEYVRLPKGNYYLYVNGNNHCKFLVW